MAGQVNNRPSWYKIGKKLFSESGNPIIIDADILGKLPDFAIVDTPDFYTVLEKGKDFKLLPTETQGVSMLKYRLVGKVTEIETHCKTVAVPQSAIDKYNLLRGLLDSPTKIDMTAFYRDVAKYSLAIPEYAKSVRRVCDIVNGVSFVGTKNYIEFFDTTLDKPAGEELFLKELYTELGPKYLEDENSLFFHINYNNKKYMVVERLGASIFLEQKPSIAIPSAAVTNYISKVRESKEKKLVWVINQNTHKDIKANSSGMHKMISGDKVDTVILLSLDSKPSIKLRLKEDIPTGKIGFSVLTPFEWTMRSDQKIEISEVPKMMEDGKGIYHIQFFIDTAQKSKKKDEEHTPVWVLEKNAILTP